MLFLSRTINWAIVPGTLMVLSGADGLAAPSGDRDRQPSAADSVRSLVERGENGHATAQYMLAQMMHQGAHMDKKVVEARRWYKAAAEQELADTQHALGIMFDRGEGGKMDKKAATRWYADAAAKGHAGAQVVLAASYLSGEGVVQNEAKALSLLRAASGQDDPRAFSGLHSSMRRGEVCRSISARQPGSIERPRYLVFLSREEIFTV